MHVDLITGWECADGAAQRCITNNFSCHVLSCIWGPKIHDSSIEIPKKIHGFSSSPAEWTLNSMIHPLKSIKIPFPGGLFFLKPRRGLLLRWSSWISRISIAAVRCTWPPSLGRPKPCLGGIRFFLGERLGNPWDGMGISPYTIWIHMKYDESFFFESSNHLKIHEY